MIKGFIEVKLDVEDAIYYNALEERDTPKPTVKKEYDWTFKDGTKPTPSYFCPVCNENVTVSKGNFCHNCGQRLDRENIAL